MGIYWCCSILIDKTRATQPQVMQNFLFFSSLFYVIPFLGRRYLHPFPFDQVFPKFGKVFSSFAQTFNPFSNEYVYLLQPILMNMSISYKAIQFYFVEQCQVAQFQLFLEVIALCGWLWKCCKWSQYMTLVVWKMAINYLTTNHVYIYIPHIRLCYSGLIRIPCSRAFLVFIDLFCLFVFLWYDSNYRLRFKISIFKGESDRGRRIFMRQRRETFSCHMQYCG